MKDRLLIISSKTKPSVGGVESIVHFLAKGVDKKGGDVYILTNIYRHNSSGGFIKYLLTTPLELIKSISGFGSNRVDPSYKIVENYMIFGGLSCFRSLLSIFLFLPSFFLFLIQLLIIRPNVINLHFADNSIVYGVLAKWLFPNKKLIVSLHGSDVEVFPGKSKVQLKLLKKILTLADNIILVSNSLKESLLSICPDIKNKIIVIPNGINDFWFEPSKDNYGMKLTKDYILYVGRLEDNKGVDLLIKAFSEIKDKELELKIVGNGSSFYALKTFANELGVESRVNFLGSLGRSKVKVLYNNARFVVMPSRSESFGIVALESMACGALLLGSNIGGLKELIKDGVNGYLFESENVKDLVNKIQFLLGSDSAEIDVIKNARNYVWDNYRQEDMINSYMKLIKS